MLRIDDTGVHVMESGIAQLMALASAMPLLGIAAFFLTLSLWWRMRKQDRLMDDMRAELNFLRHGPPR